MPCARSSAQPGRGHRSCASPKAIPVRGECRRHSIPPRRLCMRPRGTRSMWCSARSSRSMLQRGPRTTSRAWPIRTADPRLLSPHPSERSLDLYGWTVLGIPVGAGQRLPGFRDGARQGRAGDVQRGLHARGCARARAARGRAYFHARGQGQAKALGDVAHAHLGARNREPCDRGDHAEPVRSFRARPGHGGGPRGDPAREHGCGHERGRCEPRARALSARDRDVLGSSEQCAVKQGLLGPQWQRPELYDAIYPRPLREAAE